MRINFAVDTIEDIVEELDNRTLVDFLKTYDDYVASYYVDHDFGSVPVCMLEYFINDYFGCDDKLTS